MCWRHKQHISMSLNGGALFAKDWKAFSTYLQYLPLRPWLTHASQFCVVRSLPTHFRPFLSSLCFPTPSPSIGKDMTIPEVGFAPILWTTISSITILSLDGKSLIHQYQKLLSKLFVASQQSFFLKVGGKISQRQREMPNFEMLTSTNGFQSSNCQFDYFEVDQFHKV